MVYKFDERWRPSLERESERGCESSVWASRAVAPLNVVKGLRTHSKYGSVRTE